MNKNDKEKLKLAEDLYNKVRFMSSPEARETALTLEQIFPELRESEDEKIRKELIKYFCDLQLSSDREFSPSISIDEILTWLERQGKSKDQNNKIYIQKFNIGDTVYRQGWSDHTIEKIYNDGKFEPVYICKNEEGLESHISFSEQDEWKLKDRVQPQPQQDWSEEDERLRKATIEFVRQNNSFNCTLAISKEQVIAWLEKQESEPNWCHHKVDLSNCSEEYRKAYYDGWNNCNQQHAQLEAEQKHADWSEEDEGMLECIIAAIKMGDYYTQDELNRMTSWLKSLKPNHWKPSEQNIKDLEWCADLVKDKMGVGFHRLQVFIDEIKKL